jgi:predicted Zn-dependent peptidase
VTALTAGESIERLDLFPEAVMAVDRDQVLEAVRTHLHPDKLIVTAAGDFGS